MLDFQDYIEEFNKNNIQLIAASSDNLQHAMEFVNDLKLTYTMAYGLDAKETSAATGCFYNEERKHLHAAGFIIKPYGSILKLLLSEGTYDRLKAKECLDDIAHAS